MLKVFMSIATLEAGGNITLSTLRKVLVHLPNLETFSLEAVTATVLRQVDPQEQRKAIESAISLLTTALRGCRLTTTNTLHFRGSAAEGCRTRYSSPRFKQ